jgi:hypothetical protein
MRREIRVGSAMIEPLQQLSTGAANLSGPVHPCRVLRHDWRTSGTRSYPTATSSEAGVQAAATHGEARWSYVR